MSLHPADYGHSKTDKELVALVRRLEISYREARISLSEKIEKYMDQFAQEDAFKRALYDSGELSHEDYMAWRYRKLAGTKQWRDMLDQLSDDMTHRNEIAASMINDTLPDVYALNHNFGTFEVEKGSGYDTTYTLYDKHTVARLLKGNPDLLPAPHVDIAKDKRWNQQQIQSALLQGLLQGESMSDIANRFHELTPSKTVDDIRNAYKMTADQIAKAISRKNAVAAMRNARTSVTGAENAGRIDSYIRAESMGIKMKQMWIATLDGRTRDSHAILDGQQQEVGKKFSNGCRYPGDPQGAAAECYNCRCTLVAVVEGADPYNPNLRPSEYLKKQGLTYEQWKEMHGDQYYSKLFEDYEEPKQNNLIIFSNGEEANKYFGKRPDIRLRRSDRAEYDRQKEIYDNSVFAQWRNNLSGNQVGSIGEYSGDGYIPINGLLRHQMTEKMVNTWNGINNYSIQDMIGEIESAIDNFELRDSIKVYRTCENDVLENLKLNIGSIFHDPGFGSTSVLKEKVASGNIVMEIEVPKGKGYGAWVNPLSGAQDKEYEFLLQRGTNYKVKDIRHEGDDTIVSLEVIGNTREDWSFATKEEVIKLWKKKGVYDEQNAEKI